MNKPLVTAVITSYKREPAIVERALKSIISQTYSNIEIFVVDDSPADYTLRQDVKAMVESYSTYNVKYIAHEINQGACAARNTGLALSTGEFIGFLDDDDEWLPNKIEEQLKGFTDERIGLVYCSSITFDDTTNKAVVYKPASILKDCYAALLEKNNFVGSTSFPLLKTKALIDAGGFDPSMPAAQDYDTWIRVAQNYNFGFIEAPLVRYHVHTGEQITKNYDKKIAGISLIMQKHKAFLDSNPKALSNFLLYFVTVYTAKNDCGTAFKHWLQAVKINPFNARKNLIGLGRIIKCLLGFYRRKG